MHNWGAREEPQAGTKPQGGSVDVSLGRGGHGGKRSYIRKISEPQPISRAAGDPGEWSSDALMELMHGHSRFIDVFHMGSSLS